jgi:putative membrane protein
MLKSIYKKVPDMSKYFPHLLASVYVVYWAVLAIEPVSRAVWWAENIPAIGVFAFLVLTFRSFRFSNLAYGLMAFWIFWHTMGGHYTFANVPFDFITDLFGAERNHFDRIAHYSVGFYAYPIVEFMLRRRLCGPVTATLFGLFAIMAAAAGYEIIEWWYAVLEGGDAGIEFLGSQGDIWDAQKDMLLDTLGAVSTLPLYWLVRPHKRMAG